MNGKKILSSICSFLIFCNQIPFSFTTAFAEEIIPTNTSKPVEEPLTEKIELTLPVDFANNLSFSKVYDGTTIVADTDKVFSMIELVGILPEDANKVTLQAIAEYESMDAGDTNVIISDFQLLFSDDADEEIRQKYVFPSIEDISVPGKIERRKVCVNPSDDFRIVDNSSLPERVPYDVVVSCDEHTENYVLNEDENSLTNKEAILSVEKNEDGSLSFFFADGESIKTGNPNYEFVLHSDISVQPVAPEAMQVTSAIVSKKKATVLEQNDHGIYANDSVYVDIISESAEKYDDVKFQLSAKGEDLGYLTTFGYHENKKIETELTESELKKLETVTCEEVTKDENGNELENPIYIYTARFELGLVGDEKSADYSNLTCVIDNGTPTTVDGLELSKEKKDNRKSKVLIIDKREPTVVEINPKNHSDGKYFDFFAKFLDNESGIREIQWRWDSDLKPSIPWKTKKDFSHKKGDTIEIYDKVGWNESDVDPREYGYENGRHYLEVKIIDNAGNEFKSNYLTNGSDSKAPIVTYINLSVPKLSAWESIINFLSFGTFVNSDITLTLKVVDVAEDETQISGVKSVELYDGDDNDAIHLKQFEAKYKNDKYTFTLSPNMVINAWYLKLTDNNGTSKFYSISDLLKDDNLSKEVSVTGTTIATNKNGKMVTETTTTGIDWKNNLQSNKWVFDDKAPTCDVKWADSSVYNEKTKSHYYNNTGGDFIIEISDENSLHDWSVVPTNEDGEVYTAIKKSGIFDDEQSSTRYSIDTAALETGWYNFHLTATDNAGNIFDENVAAFYVDHEEPSGRIEVLSPSLETFTKKENWIKERIDGKIADIKMRLYIETKGAALNTATITVNGGKKTFSFHESDIITDESTGEMYIDFEFTPDEKSDSNGLSYNDDHTYDISADIITYSGNFSRADYKLHVDTDTPTVDTFTVEKTNSTTENILNILTFGVFFKDSLTLTVKVSDAEYDSGIDRVEIQYAGLSKAIEMKSVGDGKFTYELPLKTDIFQSEITITVYDNTGKVNTSCPDIQNTEGDRKTKENHFVMIETVSPSLIVDLPETDSTIRSDGQIWYRKHSNTEKDVEPADNEKLITVSVQDENSGLRYVQMLINGKDVVENSQDLEQSGIALPTITVTEQAENRINDKLTFQYSLEKIAEFAQANEDGSYIIEFRVVDNAGNATTLPVNSSGTEYKDGKIIYYRDTVSPTITQFSFNPTTADEIVDTDQFIDELEYGFYFKKDFTATVTVDDAAPSSGYDRVVFRLIPYANGAMQEPEEYIEKITDGNQVSYTVRAGFKGQIYATTYDKVNNKSEEKTPQAFVSDENAPTITIEPLSETGSGTDNNGNKLFTGQVQFKVTISDTESGLRTISYFKESEKDSFDSIVTEIGNLDGKNPDNIANGWQITGTDENLVTEVSQIFTFDIDDNDISMTFSATDRSKNTCEPKKSETFTIDTIPPQISIVNESTLINDKFYAGSTTFRITVTERNFDEALIIRRIENTFGNAIPNIVFDGDFNSDIHSATVIFGEGDYSFSLSGSDRGGHTASITYNGNDSEQYFFTTFNVDATAPLIKTNFGTFGKDDDLEIYFNAKQKAEAVITITEHNFYSEDVGLKIEQKPSGSSHTNDNWDVLNYFPEWDNSENSDIYTTSIVLNRDSVYRISLNPIDRARNTGVFEKGSPDHTPVFEVDTIIPTFEGRNDIAKNDKNMFDTLFYVVYAQSDKTADAPTVSFEDTNFDRIEYEYSICTPQYENGYELPNIAPNTNGDSIPSIQNKTFTLSEVQSNWLSEEKNTKDDAYKEIPDGAYAMTFTAVDKAGNRSETISASYFRMVNTDVLAYIYNSKKGDDGERVGTGFYSLMDDDGIALSKKAADFQDLDILVIKPIENEDAGLLVIREDEKEYNPHEYAGFTVESEKISNTAVLNKMHLPGNYFSETFRDDGLDTRMELSVSVRDDVYQWLGSIHIDNEIPTAILPDDLKNWHNYFFEEETTITLTGISEHLDDKLSVVYECPRNGDRVEIPHIYNEENGTYSFTLSKGVHHIDITLTDEAGNAWNIERIRYLRVGNFRLYICGGVVVLISAILFIIWRKKRRS